MSVAGLPLTIPSNRNHLCLHNDALIFARIMFGVTDVHLTLSSTRKLLFSPSSRQLLFPLPSFIGGSGARDSPFFLFTSSWTESLKLHFATTPSRQVVFYFPAFITGLFSFCPHGFQLYQFSSFFNHGQTKTAKGGIKILLSN